MFVTNVVDDIMMADKRTAIMDFEQAMTVKFKVRSFIINEPLFSIVYPIKKQEASTLICKWRITCNKSAQST